MTVKWTQIAQKRNSLLLNKKLSNYQIIVKINKNKKQ